MATGHRDPVYTHTPTPNPDVAASTDAPVATTTDACQAPTPPPDATAAPTDTTTPKPTCPPTCSDLNPCTTDTCDAATGTCSHLPTAATCTDGNPCTDGDTCANGSCLGAKWLTCDDNNPCTSDKCDPGKGCVNDKLPDGTSCDDGTAATVDDVCSAGTCAGASTCTVGEAASCKALLAVKPGLTSKHYCLDVDGTGGHPAFLAYCQLENEKYPPYELKAWTQVLNVFDTPSDDVPNNLASIQNSNGWQQKTSGGGFDLGVTRVLHAIGPGVSSAVSIEMFKKLGADHLKLCFVSKDGQFESCRASDGKQNGLALYVGPDGKPILTNDGFAQCSDAKPKLTLVAPPANVANAVLKAVANTAPTYTYGRLAGAPGGPNPYPSSPGGAYAGTHLGFCIPREPGEVGVFGCLDYGAGDGQTVGFCEHATNPFHDGVWIGFGCGSAFRPWRIGDDELGLQGTDGGLTPTCAPGNEHPLAAGFRIYVR